MIKIDFLVGDNTYGSTRCFAKDFSQALERHGVKTRLHWIAEGYFFQALHAITQDPPDLTCSFSDVHLSGQPLGNLWQIPHLSLLLDPAIYFLHQMQGEHSWVSCVDQGDVDFIHTLGCKRAFYLPHAGDRALLTPPSKHRRFDAVFFGSCLSHETEDEIVLAASKRVLSHENPSILQSLIDLGIQEEDLPRYHGEVDLYTRFKDRVELLNALKTPQLHIWGNGLWKKYVPHAHVHPPVTFDHVLEIMKEAKVVINSSPRFKQGLHERIINGALCGAAILSTQAIGYTYRYGEWEDIVSHDWEERALHGQAQILAHHTWDHRVPTLLKEFNNK